MQQIKKDERWRSIPVVALTTSREPQHLCKTYNLSVAGYIVKPMNFADFVSALKTVCEYWLLCEYTEGLSQL